MINFFKKIFRLDSKERQRYRVSRVTNSGFGSYDFSYENDDANPIDFQSICKVYKKHFFLLMPSENASQVLFGDVKPDVPDFEEEIFIDFQISYWNESKSKFVPAYYILYITDVSGDYHTKTLQAIVNALEEIENPGRQ